jgi:hypothetical protein
LAQWAAKDQLGVKGPLAAKVSKDLLGAKGQLGAKDPLEAKA